MAGSRAVAFVLIAGFAIVALHCSKSSSPTQPTVTTPPPSLNAAPTSVTVSTGTSQNVSVSGGAPPYTISASPSAIAVAQILNADSATAIIQITGVTVASVSTSVVIIDNTSSTHKSVTIPITVQ